MPTVIDEIREAVRGAPISQNAVARRAGIDRGTLSRFTRGLRGLSEPSLNRLGDVLGLRVVASKRRAAKRGRG